MIRISLTSLVLVAATSAQAMTARQQDGMATERGSWSCGQSLICPGRGNRNFSVNPSAWTFATTYEGSVMPSTRFAADDSIYSG